MMSKHDTITGMCYTIRHDFGLTTDVYETSGSVFTCGMSQTERTALYRQMEQLYDHHIQPIVDELEQLRAEKE